MMTIFFKESGVRSQESGGKKEEEEKEKVFVAERHVKRSYYLLPTASYRNYQFFSPTAYCLLPTASYRNYQFFSPTAYCLFHTKTMQIFRQYIAPFIVVVIFLIAMVAVSARIFLPGDLAAPAPTEELISPQEEAMLSTPNVHFS